MTALQSEHIAESCRSLFRVGWNLKKVTDTLSAYDSFGLVATSAEITAIAETVLETENARIREENAKARAAARDTMRQFLSDLRRDIPEAAGLTGFFRDRATGATIRL